MSGLFDLTLLDRYALFIKIHMPYLGSPGGQSVSQFSPLVGSDSLRPREPQHARPPCPSQTTRVYSNPCPLSQ